MGKEEREREERRLLTDCGKRDSPVSCCLVCHSCLEERRERRRGKRRRITKSRRKSKGRVVGGKDKGGQWVKKRNKKKMTLS